VVGVPFKKRPEPVGIGSAGKKGVQCSRGGVRQQRTSKIQTTGVERRGTRKKLRLQPRAVRKSGTGR